MDDPVFERGRRHLIDVMGQACRCSLRRSSPCGSGDFLVIPPRCDHAFRAAPENTADALIVITPGIERFDYLRQVARIRRGEASRDSLLTEQHRYDTHFVTSPAW